VICCSYDEGIDPNNFQGEMKTMAFGLAMINAANRQHVDMTPHRDDLNSWLIVFLLLTAPYLFSGIFL